MRLLVVGSMGGHASIAVKLALRRGAKVNHVLEPDTALSLLRSGRGADLVMVDREHSIPKFMNSLKNEKIALDVIPCQIVSHTEAAEQIAKNEIKDFLPFPPDADLVAEIFEAVTKDDWSMLSRDSGMLSIISMAERIAPTEASILITGEPGAGKALLGNHVHRKSKRSTRCFISIDCVAIPPSFLESELFGHEKGSFAVADSHRVGKIEEADGGTLLLEEISCVDLSLQKRLLRTFQEHTIDRIGGTRPIPVNTRIIATSTHDLAEQVKTGRFLEDLYYHLSVSTLHLPPLRRRPQDILYLATHMIKKFTALNNLTSRILSRRASEALQAHLWTGNIRELENTIQHACLRARSDEIDIQDLFPSRSVEIAEHVLGFGGRDSIVFDQKTGKLDKGLATDKLIHNIDQSTRLNSIFEIVIRTLRNKLVEFAQKMGTQEENELLITASTRTQE